MSQKGGGKELRIVTRPVVTDDVVKRDPKKQRILFIINEFKQLTEKSLVKLVYELKKEKDLDLGYSFIMLGDTPSSKELAEDLRILLYLGLIETDPVSRKMKLTANGEEFLEKNPVTGEDIDKLKEAIEELKPKIMSEESAAELITRGYRRRRRRPRR